MTVSFADYTNIYQNKAVIADVLSGDRDGSKTYSISGIGDGKLFEISTTGILSFINALDCEKPTDNPTVSKYPPAKPGALRCEPLKAAGGGR